MATTNRSPQAASASPPQDLSHHLSRTAAARQQPAVKRFYKYFQIPGIGQLAGGLPNASLFPFDALAAHTAHATRFPAPSTPTSTSTISIPKTLPLPADPLSLDLTTALQYGQATGIPVLAAWLKHLTAHLHPPPYAGGAEILPTLGSTDGFSKIITTFANEWNKGHDDPAERPTLLVERWAYMTAVQTALARGMNVVTVNMDEHGILPTGPGSLTDVLENWDTAQGPRPHILYTVPTGQNPTGVLAPTWRREEVYDVCCKFDVLIAEDDPYWYLQYPSDPTPTSTSFFKSLVPSYLTLDTEGRVLRLDTFSKTAFPGARLGWITGQPALIERLLRVTETSTTQPSGLSQALLARLLVGPCADHGTHVPPTPTPDPAVHYPGCPCCACFAAALPKGTSGWGVHGFERWLSGLQSEYADRRAAIIEPILSAPAIVQAAPTADGWTSLTSTRPLTVLPPSGGMFAWLALDMESHPLSGSFELADLGLALWVFWTHAPWRVLVAPGGMFAPDARGREEAWGYVRVCFAALEKKVVADVAQRLVGGVTAFWEIKEKEGIDALLDEAAGANEVGLEGMEGMVSLMGFC
ncbi:aromatic amino acid aminotransferas-like protein [Trichodelitschia bisporula]|uniref:Aromatic amino acid aminotransferas-like protein n=1 Tax=Trichodelitschia bisporula TaxID=703511 RepID=A0A6G1I4E6_9PEZI|nr:aromatic amino acid aminotransferas-like protein [Trichodelitschia bisporula]